MLNRDSLAELSKKFQTPPRNVIREYIQHLFLAELYKVEGSDSLLFKGGTALRILYQSPRFSEDLDFDGVGRVRPKKIEDLFLSVLLELEKMNVEVRLEEAKTTSGGYLGILGYHMAGIKEEMKFEVSLRKGQKMKSDASTIANLFGVSYTLVHVPPKEHVAGKLAALEDRHKPRDYYDLYFILRHPLLSAFAEKKKLPSLLRLLEKEKYDFKTELKILLPVSHHRILKDFKKNLAREITKFLT